MHRYRIIGTMFLLIGLATTASASHSHRFHALHIEDGLSQSSIYDCFQDSRGFLWIATEDGLNRYDGNEFKVFRHDPADQNSLSYSYISRTCQDDDGNLWVGTLGLGLNRYNYRTQQFDHFLHSPDDSTSISNDYVLTVVKGTDGNLWVGTAHGLNRLDPVSGQFTRYVWPDADSDGRNDIRAILPTVGGRLWLGTGGAGVALFDPTDGSCRRFAGPDNSPGSGVVVALLQRNEQELWLGTEHGLHVLDPSRARYATEPMLQLDSFDLASASVQALVDDRHGNCWIGTVSGLVKFEKATAEFERILSDPYRPGSLSNHEISALIVDRSDVLWVGTHLGLNRLDLNGKPFYGYATNPTDDNSLSDNYVRCFIEGEKEVLWIGSYKGLDRWDRRTGEFTHYRIPTADQADITTNRIYSLVHANSGEIWVGTANGAYLFDPDRSSFRRLGEDPTLTAKLSNEFVRVIIIDRAGDTWIGTSDGLNRIDHATGQIEHFRKDPTNEDQSLCNNLVYTLAEDYDNNLWIGTIDGLSRLAPDRQRFTNYHPEAGNPNSVSSVEVLSLLPDPSGVIWIGTTEGLNRYQSDTDSFTMTSVKQGLPNDTIYAILKDDAGKLWLSTNHGLACFNPLTGEVRSYDHHDGLTSNEFNLGAAVRMKSGDMVFGNIRGFNAFDPNTIHVNTIVPELAFTDFKLFNRSAAIGEEAPLQTHISAADKVTLSHKDYVFSFEFAALHFAIPEKNQYATMLEGVDEDWVDIGTRRMVAYNNLPPGQYVFRVKAANRDGVWNQEGISVNLNITPPFWQRSWFRGLMVLFVLGIGWCVVALRTRSVNQRNLELERKVNERTDELERANQAKSEFLANMSHEIRTPLNCVIGVADLMIDSNPSAEQQEHLGMIHQSGNDLLSLINNILDLSKVEADQLGLEPVKCDLPALCRDLLGPLSALTEAKDLDLVFQCSPQTPHNVTCDPLRLRQVLVNLINNAIKFTDAGEIVVAVDGIYTGDQSGCFTFRVTDSGPGIELEKQHMLFEKFTQADASTTRKYGGTGLGLAISKQLVELMGGRIQVQSSPGQGSTFSFMLTLPTDGATISSQPAKSNAMQTPEAPPLATEPLSLRVLLAEDNVFNQTVARHVLSHMGCTVDTAGNGREAVEMSAQKSYDVILMDCQMPEMDGYEATRRIRQNEGDGIRIPILAMTANAMTGDREKCLAVGMDGYLSKPMEKTKLVAALQSIEIDSREGASI